MERRTVRSGCVLAFLLLQRLPLHAYGLGVLHLRLAEDVGMARHELGVDAARHGREVESGLLTAQLREEDDLEEEVSELALERLEVALGEGLEDLVALLEKVARERVECLLLVPRSLRAQPPHEALERRDGGTRVVSEGRCGGRFFGHGL